MSATFYDLIGVDPAAPDAHVQAAELWPNERVNATEGFNVADDRRRIVQALQETLSFDDVRAGADRDIRLGVAGAPGGGAPGQLSLSADLHVAASALPPPLLYLRDMPNVGIQLLPTGTGSSATVFFAADGRGHELLIENLPVELQLPPGLIEPDGAAMEEGDPLGFDAGDEDSVAIVKRRDPARSSVYTHVRIHLRPDGDVVLETSTPISIDRAKLSGFPAAALHDVLLIPSPRRREHFEWARNELTPPLDAAPVPGAIAVRSIGLDLGKAPFKELIDRFRDSSGLQGERVDLVLEDVVLPVGGGIPFPVPSHGTFGLRRKITDRHDIAQAYSLDAAPFRARIYSRDGHDRDGQGLYLFVDQLLFKTGSVRAHSSEAPVLEFQAGLFWQGRSDRSPAGTFGVSDDWTLQAGLAAGDADGWHLFTIASSAVSLHAVHGGLRLRQLHDAKNAWQALVDLSIRSVRHARARPGGGVRGDGGFEITTLTGRPLDVVLRDVGWSFGEMTLGRKLAAPEGMQLVFGHVVRLIVEEMGWVEEPAGGTYFSFSGGVAIGFGGGDTSAPTSERDERDGNTVGIRFRRLRFLTTGSSSAAPFKLDGIFLNLRYRGVKVAGFGYVGDETVAGFRYQEFGFGVQVELPLPDVRLSLAAEFLKGARQAVADPDDRFGYFLASLQIGWVPAGPVALYDMRALVAYNMQPALDPPGEGGESMALYQWHKDHATAIELPRSRSLADWEPLERSLAVGFGFGFSLNSCGSLFYIGLSGLVAHTEEDTRILAVGDLFLLRNREPVAFVAVEYDVAREQVGVMAGIDLTLDKLLGGGVNVPDWLSDVARLSGTVYLGNDPWTLAIGQLADQRTWIAVSFEAWGLTVRFAAALQVVDEGPKGIGVVFSISGGGDWGIGALVIYGSFGFILGTWKTGSDTSGVRAWLQLGFKIHLFYVFRFGADIRADVTYLGTHPWYATVAAELHIDTPWFLPDVTFRFETTSGESQPLRTSTITQALNSGAASSPTAPGEGSHAPLLVPPLSDGNADPGRLYSFDELAATSGAALEDVNLRTDVPLVAVDADVSLEFTNPVANDAAIASDTYVGGTDLGVQQVQSMTVRYALRSVAIQRSPRFGPGAGTWTDLVAAVDTELDISGGGSVQATPQVSFRWDADSRADGVLSPKRLLLNSRTPFSLVVGSTRNDEELLAVDPGLPCCHRDKPEPARWHTLDYGPRTPGVRLPAGERFSDDGDWWRWTAPPATVAGSQAGEAVALAQATGEGTVGSVDFATPVQVLELRFDARPPAERWTLEAYRGLALVDAQTIDAATASPVRLRGTLEAGLTRVVLRAHRDGAPHEDARRLQGLSVRSLRYLTCAEARIGLGRLQRCRSGGELAPAVGGGGKLAFLPNHDYAVTATVEVTVSHVTGGSKTLTLSQPAYFRTKGLLGLNASPNVGDELRPYVAEAYPANGTFLLYRTEPVALAFSEGMSNLLPVERVPAPGDPPEKAQLMELTLCVERVASTEGVQRLTAPGEDWLTAHGGPVIIAPSPPFTSRDFVRAAIRRALSLDARVRRYETLLDAGGCAHDPLHSSQVLLHEPVGPDGAPGAWEGQAGMRAAVRAKDAPYAERARFKLRDLGAFQVLGEGGAPDLGASPTARWWRPAADAPTPPSASRRGTTSS